MAAVEPYGIPWLTTKNLIFCTLELATALLGIDILEALEAGIIFTYPPLLLSIQTMASMFGIIKQLPVTLGITPQHNT